jgi:glycosyltransferase involved in cell wall biosynthesis
MGLHIAIDARHIHDFGIGTYIRNLVHALARIEDSGDYVLVLPSGDLGQLAGLPERFRVVPYSHSDREYLDHVAFPLFLNRLGVDLYHIPLNRVPLFMPRPYVVTIHDMTRQFFGGGLRNQLSLYRARRSLLRASKVIAVSEATRRDAESILGIPAACIRRIYNAPDPRFLSREVCERRLHNFQGSWEEFRKQTLERYQVQYPYILYAGNIRPPKNIPRLIEAFSVLRCELATRPQYSDLRLIVIGDEISRNPDVRLAVHKARIGNAVRFLGYVSFDTLRAFYESAAVFAFPSLHEGFGLPPLEAMACGAPVVASNVSSLPEVVGDAAIQINPENVFEIARALKEVLLDPELRQRLVERGFRQARRFSWDETAREVLDTYRHALSR